MFASKHTPETCIASALPSIPIDGSWKGHINGKMTRFRFEQTTNCGLVGQYTTDILDDNAEWHMFVQIQCEDDVLTLRSSHKEGGWFVQGLVTPNRVSGPYVNGSGASGTWDMYK